LRTFTFNNPTSTNEFRSGNDQNDIFYTDVASNSFKYPKNPKLTCKDDIIIHQMYSTNEKRNLDSLSNKIHTIQIPTDDHGNSSGIGGCDKSWGDNDNKNNNEMYYIEEIKRKLDSHEKSCYDSTVDNTNSYSNKFSFHQN